MREVLEKKKITFLFVGNDPVTKLNGLFKGCSAVACWKRVRQETASS